MAAYQNIKAVNLVAGEDLRDDVYEAVTLNSSGQVVKTTAATDIIVGFVAEDPVDQQDTTGLTVPVALVGAGGVGLAKASAVISAGQFILASATAGQVAGVAAPTTATIGIALEDAVAGDIFRVVYQS